MYSIKLIFNEENTKNNIYYVSFLGIEHNTIALFIRKTISKNELNLTRHLIKDKIVGLFDQFDTVLELKNL